MIDGMMLKNGEWTHMESPLDEGESEKVMDIGGNGVSHSIVVRRRKKKFGPEFIIEAEINHSSMMRVGAWTMGDMISVVKDLTQLTYHAMMIDAETSK